MYIRSMNFQNTYWGSSRKYTELSKKLSALVPYEGKCPSDKPKLERFRKASNAYYDMYNNGLSGEFSRIFKVKGTIINPRSRFAPKPEDSVTTPVIQQAEAVMDRIVIAAAKEAGFEIP